MGLLGKVAAYRWLSNGGGGGGGGQGGLVILFAILAAVLAAFWLAASALSFIWGVIYGVVHPVLATAPIVTIPLSVLLVGSLFTLLEPYSYDTAVAYLDGNDDKLTNVERTVWVVLSVNSIVAIGATGVLEGEKGILGMVLAIVVALLAMYGFFELLHTPYRCTKLLLNAPDGRKYVVLFLAPMLLIVIVSAFGVEPPLPEINSGPLGLAAGLAVYNATYIGGPLAVHWNQTAIRKGAREREQSSEQDTDSSSSEQAGA
jgi:hypothetical protein